MTGLMSATMLAELMKANPQVYGIVDVTLPSGTVKRWSDAPLNIKARGIYEGKVTAWGGPFERSLSDRDGNLQTPSMKITIDDSTRELAAIFEGADANRIRGASAIVTLASPNVTSTDWFRVLNGVVAGWDIAGVTEWQVTCQYNDVPLRGFIPTTAFMASDWSNADPAIYGGYVPLIYGVFDSSLTGNIGLIPLYLADKSTSTPEYVASLGWLKAVGPVWVDGVVASTTQYSVNHPVKNSRRFTTVKFNQVITTASSSGAILTTSPSSSSSVVADCQGFETIGDGTGSLLFGPNALGHFLENFVFRNSNGQGPWSAIGTYTAATQFTAAALWATQTGAQYTSRWIGGTEQVRAMDEVAGFLRTLQCHGFWTNGGQFGILPFDLRDTTVWYDSPQWLFEAEGDVVTPLRVKYDYTSIVNDISIQYLFAPSVGNFLGSLDIKDQSIVDQAPDSLQMPWSPSTKALTGFFNAPVPSRETGSYRLNRFRHPLMTIGAEVPLWGLDRELLDGVSWSHRLGPSSVMMGASTTGGSGWGKKVWQRRASRVASIGVDMQAKTVTYTCWDRRFVDCTLWDTMLTTKSVNAEAQGIPRIISGANRIFSRSTKTYVPDPSDGTIREIAAGVDAITVDGYLTEITSTNMVTRSAFVSGLTGWTIVTGSAATDTASTLWDTTLTPGGVRMASTSGGVSAEITHATTAVGPNMIAGGGGGRFSFSYLNDTTSGNFTYDIQRSSDLKWFIDGTGAWTSSGAQLNAVPVSTAKTRFISTTKVVAATSGESFTLHLTLPTALIGHVYDVQMEDRPYATARILTDGAAGTRDDSCLLYQDFTTLRSAIWPAVRGTMGIEFVADWNEIDSPSNGVLVTSLGDGTTGGASGSTPYDYWAVLLQGSGGGPTGILEFRAFVGGLTYSAFLSPVTIVRGTRYRVVARWTGSSSGLTDSVGELGLPYRTDSIFLSTTSGTTFTKGTDVVRLSSPAASPYGWLSIGRQVVSYMAQAPSLKLWLMADTGVYKDAGVTLAVDGDPVAQWNDQSTAGNNFNQVLINRPVFKTGIVNGKPVVRFAGGSSQYLTSSTAGATFLSALLGAGGVGHMFVVYNPSSFIAGDPLIIDANTVAGVVLATTSGGFTATGTFAFNVSGGIAASQQQASPAGTWACVEWIHTAGSTLYSSISGTKSAGSSSGATDASGVVWLGHRASLQNFTGDIAEVLVFSQEITSTATSSNGVTLAQVQEYLQHKYGVGFSTNPAPRGQFQVSAALSRLRITPHVLADDELARLFT